jgi:hypothetical protein
MSASTTNAALYGPVLRSQWTSETTPAIIDGQPEHSPDGVYSLRYLQGKKRIFERVGFDAQVALDALSRMDTILAAKSTGVPIAEDKPEPASSGKPCRKLSDYITIYNCEIGATKSRQTFAASSEHWKLEPFSKK